MTASSAFVAPVCTRFQQTLTIKDFLPADYYPGSDTEIFLTLGEVTNPVSIYKVQGLKITILAEGLYAVDEYEGPITWTLRTGSFGTLEVKPQSYVAYRAENEYMVTFRPEHKIPQNGYLEIMFPVEVSVPDMSFSQSSCAALETSGFPSTQITCEFTAPQPGDTHFMFKILNAFRRMEGEADVDYVFTVPGIRNPIQTIPTSDFIFQTLTRDDQPIDRSEGAAITMLTPAELQQVQVSLGSYSNSAKTTYEFTLVPSVPVKQSNFVMLTFPEEITLPEDSATLACSSTFDELIESLECDYDPAWPQANTVRVRMTLKVPQIDALDRFSVLL